MNIVADGLRNHRHNTGITLQKTARRMGVSYTAVARSLGDGEDTQSRNWSEIRFVYRMLRAFGLSHETAVDQRLGDLFDLDALGEEWGDG